MTNGHEAGALHPTTTTFDEALAGRPEPVLLGFWAPWCGPCRAIAPMIDELANEMTGQATVVKIKVEAEPKLATRFGVQALPALIFLTGGQAIDTLVGTVPKAVLLKRLQALRGAAPEPPGGARA